MARSCSSRASDGWLCIGVCICGLTTDNVVYVACAMVAVME